MTVHLKASKKWVCNSDVETEGAALDRAIDIWKNILRSHGVRLPYKGAWMGKKIAKAVIHGNEISSCDFLL